MKFVVFEGPDGSGQTTQVKLLADYLRKKGFEVFETKEPTNETAVGKLIRDVLQHRYRIGDDTLQLLFTADRAEHLQEIEKALKAKKWVVCDRYILSTLAYGSASGLDLKWLESLNEKFRWPDYTFLLDVPAEICMERLSKSRSNLEYFEKREKLERILQQYKEIVRKRENVFVLDGTKPKEMVHKEVLKVMRI